MTIRRLPVIDPEDRTTIEQLRSHSPEAAASFEALLREQAAASARDPVVGPDYDHEREMDRRVERGHATGGGRRRGEDQRE